jgi:hypothetical protein
MLETPPDWSQVEGSNAANEPLHEPLANLAIEITRVSAELQSINAGFQAQMLQALAEVQRVMEADFQVRMEREIARTRKELLGRIAETENEIQRVTTLLETVGKEITTMIDDPNAELSKVMRKKSEETVLRSYLDGLKFAAGLPR